MVWSADGRMITIVDSDDYYVDGKNPLFGPINGASRCVISLNSH